MEKEFYKFNNLPIEISEGKNCKIATFLISVLDEYNLNGCLIADEEGKKYCKTAIGKPIQAALRYDENGNPDNYKGHEVKIVVDEDGNLNYKFCTQSIGAITDAWVESRDVKGYSGKHDCIMIKATLWSSRYPNYFQVFDKLIANGGISSSWEIDVTKSEKTSKGRQLKEFEFLGNCLLGSDVQEAVPGAGLVECSSADNNILLSEALHKDLQSIDNASNNEEGGSVNMDNTQNATSELTVSSLTMEDIGKKINQLIDEKEEFKDTYVMVVSIYPEEHRVILKDWHQDSDDFYETTYSVENDVVTLGEIVPKKLQFVDVSTIKENENTISTLNEEIKSNKEQVESLTKEMSEKDSILVKANENKVELENTIEDLKKQIAELEVSKQELDKINAEKEANELAEKQNKIKQQALNSKLISEEEIETSEEIKSIINNVDEDGLNKIIATRYMNSLNQESGNTKQRVIKEVFTSEIDKKSLMQNYLKR